MYVFIFFLATCNRYIMFVSPNYSDFNGWWFVANLNKTFYMSVFYLAFCFSFKSSLKNELKTVCIFGNEGSSQYFVL